MRVVGEDKGNRKIPEIRVCLDKSNPAAVQRLQGEAVCCCCCCMVNCIYRMRLEHRIITWWKGNEFDLHTSCHSNYLLNHLIKMLAAIDFVLCNDGCRLVNVFHFTFDMILVEWGNVLLHLNLRVISPTIYDVILDLCHRIGKSKVNMCHLAVIYKNLLSISY